MHAGRDIMTAGQAPEQKTMDEILASIRQIISDDEAKGTSREAAPGPRAVESAPPAREKVSPLFGFQKPKPVAAEPQASGQPRAGQEAVDAAIERALGEVGFDSRTNKPATPSPTRATAPSRPDSPFRPPEGPRQVPADEHVEDLDPLPRIVTAAADSSPEAGAEAETPEPGPILSPNAEARVGASFDELAAAARTAGGRPLAALVEQTLRPMLKSWLDENLPHLVERLVREEIERIKRERR
jgi:cell pole-organizing protein PopZ